MMPPDGQINPTPEEPTSSSTPGKILKDHLKKSPDPKARLGRVAQAQALREAINQYREMEKMGFSGIPEGLDAVLAINPEVGFKGLQALLETQGNDQGRVASAVLGQMWDAFSGNEPPKDARKGNHPHYAMGYMADKYLETIQEALEDTIAVPEAAVKLPSGQRQQYQDLLNNVRRVRLNWAQSQGAGIRRMGQYAELDDQYGLVEAMSGSPEDLQRVLKAIHQRKKTLMGHLRNYDWQAAKDARADGRLDVMRALLLHNRAYRKAVRAGQTDEADRLLGEYPQTLRSIRDQVRGQIPQFGPSPATSPAAPPVPTTAPAPIE